MKFFKKLSLPGQRIFRTMVAVWICLLIYLLRGQKGLVVFSAIAAMQGIQPYTKDMRTVILRRIVGTIIGAFWGLLLLLIELELISIGEPSEVLHYFLVGLGVGIVIYSTVLFNVRDWASFSAVTFMSVTITHLTDANPYLFAFNRLVDTLIGVGVAEIVNRIQLPRSRHTDTLFVSSVSNLLAGENHKLSPYSRVELNRMIEDGAKFTLSTIHTQARIRELLPGVNLRYPMVIMDGAALYDMNTMEYLRTTPMSEEKARRVIEWAHGRGLSFFNNSVSDNLLVIQFSELGNEAIRKLYEKKRLSPYRNFINSPRDTVENVLYLQIVAPEEEVEPLLAELNAQPWAGDYRFTLRECEIEGYGYLLIYDYSVSRESMLRELEKLMGTKQTVTFGGVPNKYDVYIRDADKNLFVKELKKRFEPVDLRNWKTAFRV